MSDAPKHENSNPELTGPASSGRTGHGVESVLPFLHKQVQVKIPVPLDELVRDGAGPPARAGPVRQSPHERSLDE